MCLKIYNTDGSTMTSPNNGFSINAEHISVVAQEFHQYLIMKIIRYGVPLLNKLPPNGKSQYRN
jgi:hypothetical protein